MAMPPFHLAFPVLDLNSTRRFYGGLLGCAIGRRAGNGSISIFSAIRSRPCEAGGNAWTATTNAVDGDHVPVSHFGAILDGTSGTSCPRAAKRGHKFIIEPHIRFKGEIGEQATMFFFDPSGNALEFKSFKDMANVFAH